MPENEKQTNKERLKDITDSIERGIEELFQSDKYAEYLRTMSRFHKYSVNNTMLIYMQRPDATMTSSTNTPMTLCFSKSEISLKCTARMQKPLQSCLTLI